jgi:hypothetical protein
MAETKPASLAKTFWLYGVGYLSILYLASIQVVYTPIVRLQTNGTDLTSD